MMMENTGQNKDDSDIVRYWRFYGLLKTNLDAEKAVSIPWPKMSYDHQMSMKINSIQYDSAS